MNKIFKQIVSIGEWTYKFLENTEGCFLSIVSPVKQFPSIRTEKEVKVSQSEYFQIKKTILGANHV